jgi:hypothetical protein
MSINQSAASQHSPTAHRLRRRWQRWCDSITVLPEYGIDPTGVGRALGLMRWPRAASSIEGRSSNLKWAPEAIAALSESCQGRLRREQGQLDPAAVGFVWRAGVRTP